MILPFGHLSPDQADYKNGGIPTAENCIPHQNGYVPLQSLVDMTTGTITGQVIGGIGARQSDGTAWVFAVEDPSSNVAIHYNKPGTDNTWTTPTLASWSLSTSSRLFDSAQFKDKVIFCHIGDGGTNESPIQVFEMGVDTNFSALTTDFYAQSVAVIREFVVFGNTWDATDTYVPNRVRWSAQGDETDYTASDVTQAGANDLLSGGRVMGITGGEFGIVVCESAIWRMTYAGPPPVWQFDEIDAGIGSIARRSITKHNNVTYFLSSDGFRATAGEASANIGTQLVDQTALDLLNYGRIEKVIATRDPINNLVAWGIPTGSPGGTNNSHIFLYHPPTKKWSINEVSHDYLMLAISDNVDLDSMDSYGNLDTLGVSLDSPIWQGLAIGLGAFSSNHQFGYFAGTNYEATLETAEFDVGDSRKGLITGARALVDGGTTTLELATRDRQADSATYHGAQPSQTSGYHRFRNSGRFGRFRAKVSGAWEHALGVGDVEVRPMGRR